MKIMHHYNSKIKELEAIWLAAFDTRADTRDAACAALTEAACAAQTADAAYAAYQKELNNVKT